MEMPKRVRGTQDLYGDVQRFYTYIKKVTRYVFRTYNFTRVDTPILEQKALIERSSGLSSDIVSKELYELIDKKGRRLVMRPESTAGVMRLYLERMQDQVQPVNMYYIGPQFRYDRPQKGRFRQFHQVGAEVIGEADPILDAQSIFMGKIIMDHIGLEGEYTIKINTLGKLKEREKYIEELKAFFESKQHLLDETDKERVQTNPLRILDSKNPDVQEILPYAPQLKDYLKKDSAEFYADVKEYLDLLGVKYVEDPTLVRGLDYYCDTVWEFVDDSGRSQDSFGGGGRYDGLAEALGHKKSVPGVGFAMGVERMIDAMIDHGYDIVNKDKIDLYFIQTGDEAKKVALPISIEARKRGINTLTSFGTPSLRAQLKRANQLKARYVIIIGIMEARNRVCQLKDMEKGTQEQIPLDDILDIVSNKLGAHNLNFYTPLNELFQRPIQEESEELMKPERK